ncbi:stage II sporulation protein R [Ornithinibacillus gellani]|uniref:stage II sporulation protein R n=1 Tax=Ornithinibacillus gellani TaxID=2293253 RepID=UPI000F49B18A|nr:stage II sporulation protein R [Ornithinibacillus gellani]TQS72229.1 stage II sporulation protein R [Ornithinibacillus gellani]
MKKAILLIGLCGMIMIIFMLDSKQSASADYEVIPDDAIRLRILANSDSEADQRTKRLIRDQVNETISGWVAAIDDKEEAKQLIASRIPELNQLIGKELAAAGMDIAYEVEYDRSVSFPTKVYGNYLYPAGEYEAVLITLGAGKGANWWCVLFPPLCFLDFGNGISTADAAADISEQEEEPVKVKFFLWEWLGWS